MHSFYVVTSHMYMYVIYHKLTTRCADPRVLNICATVLYLFNIFCIILDVLTTCCAILDVLNIYITGM